MFDDVRVYVVDGSNLRIGEGCMISDHVDIRTTDNHAIYDIKTGKRINWEEDVEIGPRVWIGTRVIVLKGSRIPEGCIVGAGSVVTKKHMFADTMIVGNPARPVKENVIWTMER